MKVNLPVEPNNEKHTIFYKYPSKSIHKILNYKPVYTCPDKCKREKVAMSNY